MIINDHQWSQISSPMPTLKLESFAASYGCTLLTVSHGRPRNRFSAAHAARLLRLQVSSSAPCRTRPYSAAQGMLHWEDTDHSIIFHHFHHFSSFPSPILSSLSSFQRHWNDDGFLMKFPDRSCSELGAWVKNTRGNPFKPCVGKVWTMWTKKNLFGWCSKLKVGRKWKECSLLLTALQKLLIDVSWTVVRAPFVQIDWQNLGTWTWGTLCWKQRIYD